jgi:asparagine synthase (glutamine-hydrolysing)
MSFRSNRVATSTASPPPSSLPIELGAGPAPGFVAVMSSGPTITDNLPGNSLWSDVPSVRVYGNWRPEEVLQARHASGRLLIVGHCLASPHEVTDAFGRAMESESFDPLMTLPGAYTCLIVRDGELVAITDLAGRFPVYHSRRGGEILIGLHAGVLAARHDRPLDPVTAAARIACPSVLPLWSSRSPYRDVHCVGGGAVLRVGAGHLRVDSEPLLPVPGMTREEGASALRSSVVDAVQRRCLVGPISSDLSGGLDSTTLALLATRYSQGPVHAVVYHHPLAPAADLADATRYARLDPKIALTVVRGTDHTLPYLAISGFGTTAGPGASLTSEPAAHALSWRRSALRLAQAAEWGTRTHLTGEGGDAVLGATPAYLAELVKPRSLAGLVRHCGALARLRHTSPALLARRAMRAAVTRPSTALGRLATALRRPTSETLSWPDAVCLWPTSGEAVAWLTVPMRQHLAEVAADPVTARSVPRDARPADLTALTELRHSAGAQRYLCQLGNRMGVAVHAPFLDNMIVRACLRVPASQRMDPWIYKPLLPSAMTGLVPDQVFDRRSKGDYTAEDYRGARRAAPRLRDLLHNSRLADLGVIEPGRVNTSLDRLFTGTTVPLGELNQLLATELWLRDLDGADTWSGLPW